MLTLFSIPKAFRGHIGVIQRNAIESWMQLNPRPEIVLLGDDEGTPELAGELGLRNVPKIARSDHGTPLLSDMFRQAEAITTTPFLCYVNADIILTSDFLKACEIVRKEMPKSLLVAKRISMDHPDRIVFEAGWEERLKERAKRTGKEDDYTFIDAFAYARGMYPQVPDFAIGRLWFDHWLIKAVRQQNLPVVDGSQFAPLYHQNHDYNHAPGGYAEVWKGEEAKRNFQLYGGVQHAYTLLDATHKLTPAGALRRLWMRKRMFKAKQAAWEILVHRTAAVRHALGLRRKGPQPEGT
jgi:hypothetical protein